MYYLLKVSFLVWLMHPYTQGAAYLYNTYLHAAFKRYSQLIDSVLARLSTGAASAGAVATRIAAAAANETERPAAPAAPAFDPSRIFGQHNGRSE
jgi:hypothetical protein